MRVNNTQVTPENKESVFALYMWMPKTDNPVELTVRRNGVDVKLSATPREKLVMRYHVAKPSESATDEQIAFRKKVLKKNS